MLDVLISDTMTNSNEAQIIVKVRNVFEELSHLNKVYLCSI
jgi:hypothetical protein